jgi:hypothetical protein
MTQLQLPTGDAAASSRYRFVDKRYIDDAVGVTDAVAPPELVATRFQRSGPALFRTCRRDGSSRSVRRTVVFGGPPRGLAALESVSVPAVLEDGDAAREGRVDARALDRIGAGLLGGLPRRRAESSHVLA